MGKVLGQQARGKGAPVYLSKSFRFKGQARLPSMTKELIQGKIRDVVNCPGHSAPLAYIEYDNGRTCLVQAPLGVRVGQDVASGEGAPATVGNTLALKDIPEGTSICNIEKVPGDGGKFCRTSGSGARLVGKSGKFARVIMPSKREKQFPLTARAMIGVVAGGGRTDKPILKAGAKHHARRARNKRYPLISGAAQNAVDHPFGNKRSSRTAHQKPTSKFASPGRKVGTLWPKRTGKRK